MQLGMVGLGRMGAGIVRRVMHDGHHCVGYDVSPDTVKALEADGVVGSESRAGVAAPLDHPRPAGGLGAARAAAEVESERLER